MHHAPDCRRDLVASPEPWALVVTGELDLARHLRGAWRSCRYIVSSVYPSIYLHVYIYIYIISIIILITIIIILIIIIIIIYVYIYELNMHILHLILRIFCQSGANQLENEPCLLCGNTICFHCAHDMHIHKCNIYISLYTYRQYIHQIDVWLSDIHVQPWFKAMFWCVTNVNHHLYGRLRAL